MAEMLSTPLGVIEWFVYLLAAVMFVIGLHLMNSPKTARKGNMVSAVGMILAVVMAFIVLFAGEISNGFQHGVAVVLLIAGIIIGAVAGVVSAKKVKMTDMPQLVSVFNTVGGGAAALVALNDILTSEGTPSIVVLITAGLGIMIGSVTFSGSLIAAGDMVSIRKLPVPSTLSSFTTPVIRAAGIRKRPYTPAGTGNGRILFKNSPARSDSQDNTDLSYVFHLWLFLLIF